MVSHQEVGPPRRRCRKRPAPQPLQRVRSDGSTGAGFGWPPTGSGAGRTRTLPRHRDPLCMDAVSSIPTPSARRRDLVASPALALFLALFASQSGVLVLSPILSDVADDFGVSIATAGQLRIVAAPLAAAVALLAARSLVRFSPRAVLGAGSVLVALGSVASALAPSFATLALAQVPLWAGISMLLTAAIAASAAWSTPESRTRVVAIDVRRAARSVDRRDAADRRRRRSRRLAAFVPRPAAPRGAARRARRRRTATGRTSGGRRNVAARPSPPLGAASLGARRAARDVGVGGNARLLRRAPDGRIRHDDDGDGRRARRGRRRLPARKPAGRERRARSCPVDDDRDERRRRCCRRPDLGVHAHGGPDAGRVRDQRRDGRDANGDGHGLRVLGRGRPRP